MTDKYYDWTGAEIEIGTHVLYAISSSHYASLVYGEVIAIIPLDTNKKNWYGRSFKLKVQPFFENTDVIEGTDRGWEYVLGDGEPGKRELVSVKRVNPKPVTLQNVEKVTVFRLPDETLARIDQKFEDNVVAQNKELKERRDNA